MEKIKIQDSRRDFLRKTGQVVGIGMFASSFSTLVMSCEKDEIVPVPPLDTLNIDLNKYPKLAVVGGIDKILLKYKNGIEKSAIAVRKSAADFDIFDTICTHQNVEVELPASPGGDLVCPAHGATFSSADGTVKNKPFSNINNLFKYKVESYDAANNILKIIA